MNEPIRRRAVEAKCPIRSGDICNLCQLDVTGPQDCPLVYLVRTDPDLEEQWTQRGKAR
jgi:hypothetical protein